MSHPIHPMLVHFPIALLFTSVLFDLVFFFTGREEFKKGGFWLLILGWIAGLAAILSGGWSEEIAEKAGVPEAAIERHELFAMTTLALFAGLMLLRIWVRNRWSTRDRLLYTCMAMIGLSFLATTGYFGGDLVYRYGAGVQSSAPALISVPAPEQGEADG